MTPGFSDCEAVLIAGPTASGKSALALALAALTGGAIVNADALQVYRELAILTARPTAAEMAAAPHLLYGHVPAGEAYSVARWSAEMAGTLARLRAEGRLAIIAGGTGLYFHALLHGLSPIPGISPEVRRHVRMLAAQAGACELHRRLAARDPVMAARLPPGDTQRLARALEVLEETGQSLAQWQQVKGTPLLSLARTRAFVLMPPRDWLYRRCDARFLAMLEAEALAEARALATLDPELPAARALGLPQLIGHLEGTLTLVEATALAQRETRRFAKRQMTWFRNQMRDCAVLDPQLGVHHLLAMLSRDAVGS